MLKTARSVHETGGVFESPGEYPSPEHLTLPLHAAAILLGSGFVALVLRAVSLGSKGIWMDEAYAIHLARLPFATLIEKGPRRRNQHEHREQSEEDAERGDDAEVTVGRNARRQVGQEADDRGARRQTEREHHAGECVPGVASSAAGSDPVTVELIAEEGPAYETLKDCDRA